MATNDVTGKGKAGAWVHQSLDDDLQPLDPRKLGPFRIVARLGSGAMAVVYLGLGPGGRKCAVIGLPSDREVSAEFRAGLVSQASALRTVDSPYVPRLVAVDAESDLPYLAMTYTSGIPLDRVVPAGGLSAPDARVAGRQLAEALAAVHEAGIVHSDVKPSNVLVDDGAVCLVDYGMASFDVGGQGVDSGTLAWRAPEAIAGERATEASDVFGLGLVLGFMALGRHPFGVGHPQTLVDRILHGSPDLHGALAVVADLIQRTLSPDPSQRPSAEAVARELAGGVAPSVTKPRARLGGRRVGVGLAAVGIGSLGAVAALAIAQEPGTVPAQDAAVSAPERIAVSEPSAPALPAAPEEAAVSPAGVDVPPSGVEAPASEDSGSGEASTVGPSSPAGAQSHPATAPVTAPTTGQPPSAPRQDQQPAAPPQQPAAPPRQPAAPPRQPVAPPQQPAPPRQPVAPPQQPPPPQPVAPAPQPPAPPPQQPPAPPPRQPEAPPVVPQPPPEDPVGERDLGNDDGPERDL